ncbi:GHKL domain-containing protein [Salinimonas sp. HHU 13199]|uniref:histidine kinase n=1 Tax=Salinimonas profundi TaxID=2729140 RepID=A0ABR8LFM2_9ALTE|nr:ATP-binding protein [Salinimonas profundi]MBD3585061.1 GHKL domain-containing protein [Salinimonas profundi]
MRRLSLKIRSLLLAVVALVIFLPVTAYVLEDAYSTSLTQAKADELKLMNLSLISEFELSETGIQMPDLLYDEQLNLPDSSFIGIIMLKDKIVWQSASSLGAPDYTRLPAPAVGQSVFEQNYRLQPDNTAHFLYAYTAEFAQGDDFIPVRFYVLNDTAAFSAKRALFLETVWKGLAGLGGLLLLIVSAGHVLILAPVRTLIAEIKQASDGKQERLTARYPKEFDGLKKSINQLIATESQQRSRYKNSLGDLAHSLKTPLAVAMGTSGLPHEANDALEQVDLLIQRQLKRATAGTKGWQAPVPVKPVSEKLARSMQTIYRDKSLTIDERTNDNAVFYGDETDLFEILGNLLDNACKAADEKVSLSVTTMHNATIIIVEDDGPGIPATQQHELLGRGARLDTYTEGQGIGMAVVSDLVDIYQGQIIIEDSTWGGARIQIRLPYPDAH